MSLSVRFAPAFMSALIVRTNGVSPGQTFDGGVDDRRDVDECHQAAAMIFISTEIGVGSESTPTVVRVGWILPSTSA